MGTYMFALVLFEVFVILTESTAGGILADDKALLLGEHFKTGTLVKIKCLSESDGNNNSSQLVHTYNISCSFHNNYHPIEILSRLFYQKLPYVSIENDMHQDGFFIDIL